MGSPSELGGDFYCQTNQLTSLVGAPSEVGGAFSCQKNQLTSLVGAPSEVGGAFSCQNNQLTSLVGAPISNLNKKNYQHKESVASLISAKLLVKGILLADNIMSKIISRRSNVFKIRIYGSSNYSYCIYSDGSFSHGKTIKEARESLLYKQSVRDISEFKEWDLTTPRSVADLIASYRSITGACSSGVQDFCKSINLNMEKKYSVSEIIRLTDGKYGQDYFKNFEWA